MRISHEARELGPEAAIVGLSRFFLNFFLLLSGLLYDFWFISCIFLFIFFFIGAAELRVTEN